MRKRRYTHIQRLFPKIKAMIEAGKTQREITEYYGLSNRRAILYLSMNRDLFDNSIVAYKTGTEQTINLVLDTIRLAMRRESKRVAAELQRHSDRGF